MSFWKFVRRMIILNFFFDLFSGKSDDHNGCSHHCDDYDDKPHNHFTGFLNNSRQNNFDDYGIFGRNSNHFDEDMDNFDRFCHGDD